MVDKRINGYIRWIGTALAIAAIVFNTAILWNDVKHLQEDMREVRHDIKMVCTYLMGK